MGVCEPCREDHHARCTSVYNVDVVRKGVRMKTRKVTCECVCKAPPGWRGEPQPVPRWTPRGG